jgi:hypothetical protein
MPSTLPPRGHYRADVAVITARVPDGAFRCWHLIAAHNWRGEPCTLTDAEQGSLLGVDERTIRRYHQALRDAGLLGKENFPSGERGLWAKWLTDADVHESYPHDVDNSVDNSAPPDNIVLNGRTNLSISRPNDGGRGGEYITHPTQKSLSLRKGGLGENRTEASAPDNGVQPPVENSKAALELLAVFAAAGVVRGAEIIARARAESIGPDDLRALFEFHWMDTEGEEVRDRAALVAWRLLNTPLALTDEQQRRLDLFVDFCGRWPSEPAGTALHNPKGAPDAETRTSRV